MKVDLVHEFRFESAHRLPNVPKEHKCFRMHGHSFRAEVRVKGDVDEKKGWLIDYADIAKAVAPVKDALDHRTLNDVPGLENPTSEMIARWIWQKLEKTLPGLSEVTVRETCTSRCEYRGE